MATNQIAMNNLVSDPITQLIGLIALFTFVFYGHRKYISLNNEIKNKIEGIYKKDLLSYLKISYIKDITKRRKLMMIFSWASVIFSIFLIFQVGTTVLSNKKEQISIGFVFLAIAGIVAAFIFESLLDVGKVDRATSHANLENIIKDKSILKSAKILSRDWEALDEDLKERISETIVELLQEKEENKGRI